MQVFDLFVIGGGINGAGIARDAAGRGLNVGLAEQDDFGGATSSASSKLIHGGLRYLEHFEFRLVAESVAEREVLLRHAGHLIRPLEFVLPQAPDMRPAWMIRTGLWFYDYLGGHRSLPPSRAIRLDARAGYGKGLKPELKQAFTYWDAWVDDARLVIANLRSAAHHGGNLMPRTRFMDAQVSGREWRIRLRLPDGEEQYCGASMLINAAGPWAGQVLRGMPTATRAQIRLVKGSHIVVPRIHDAPYAYILQNADKRVLFILPFEEDFSLIGTTEVTVQTPDGTTNISPEETRYLIDAANAYLEKPLTEESVRWTYSGVRPLYEDGSRNSSKVTRDYTLKLELRDGAPLLNIYGGKITTYRTLAEAALRKLSPWMNEKRGPWTAEESLPGSDFVSDATAARARLATQYAQLPPALLDVIFGRHGSESGKILGDAATTEDLGMCFGAQLYEREVRHFIEHEWAQDAADILWRRTKAGLHMSDMQRRAFTTWFAQQ